MEEIPWQSPHVVVSQRPARDSAAGDGEKNNVSSWREILGWRIEMIKIVENRNDRNGRDNRNGRYKRLIDLIEMTEVVQRDDQGSEMIAPIEIIEKWKRW